MHQVGDQPRLYYDAWSTNHQDAKWCVCDVAGVPPLHHHLQGVTHHYTTVITDPYQRLYNNPMPMVEMLGVSLHSRG